MAKVGDGATISIGSDRYAGTVTRVSPSGKTITVQLDKSTRSDTNGLSENQEYTYERNPRGKVMTFRATKHGLTSGSYRLSVGERSAYCDPSF